MSEYTFTVILEPDMEDGGFTAYAPALKGCHTYGQTKQEALQMIQEAISLYIETLMANNETIPSDTQYIETVKVVA